MTTNWDKAEALVVCFRNLKGAKSKDLLLTAQALQYLKSLPEFGSNNSVGEAVGVSGEIVRQFIGLLDLPPSILEYLENGDLGLEHGRRLGQLRKARSDVLEQAAEAMTKLKAMEARDLAEYLVRNPEASVQDSLESLEAARQVVHKQFHVGLLFDEETYRLLESHSRTRQMRTTELATTIVSEWLEEHDKQ